MSNSFKVSPRCTQALRNGAQSDLPSSAVSLIPPLPFPVFEETLKYKKSQEPERIKQRKEISAKPKLEFDLVVKAANPKKKITTLVRIAYIMLLKVKGNNTTGF